MINFDNNKPIYIQIADNICERILSGEITPGARIASVREWGALIGVNPNTVVRSYDLLSERGVIFNQRGIGYFVADDARDIILEMERKRFLEEEAPLFISRAKLLGVNLNELLKD